MFGRIVRWWSLCTKVAPTVLGAEPVASAVPPWGLFPGVTPLSAAWRMGGPDKLIDAFLMHWRALDEAARHQYLDRHRAPAAWRRWLDGGDGAREVYYRHDAPMARLVPPNFECPLEELVAALERGGAPSQGWLERWSGSGDPVAKAWDCAGPWGIRDALRRAGHSATEAVTARVAEVDAGRALPGEVARSLRRCVSVPPALAELLRPRRQE